MTGKLLNDRLTKGQIMIKKIRQAIRLYNRIEETKKLHLGKESTDYTYWAGWSLGRDQGILSILEEHMSDKEFEEYDNMIKNRVLNRDNYGK